MLYVTGLHAAARGTRRTRVRLLEALHAEAVRLSALVRELGAPGSAALPGTPWHFEEVAAGDLVAMALRRLRQEGGGSERVRVEGDLAAVPPLRAEVSALSGAIAHLLRTLLARSAPSGGTWVAATRQGAVTRVDLGTEGRGAALAELEAALDDPLGGAGAGRLSVRENVSRHAGEVWAWADGERLGFRLTLPAAEERAAPVAAPRVPSLGPRFIGAGTTSGSGAVDVGSERPELYDFSLFEEMERHLQPADRERLLEDLEWVVLDTETTGLDPDGGDRIVLLAGVRVRGSALRRGERFDALVNPGRPIPVASVRFHGITDEHVRAAPPIDLVLPAFLRFADGTVLVGHQVWFDLQFLNLAAARLGRSPLSVIHPVLDTLTLSEVVHGRLDGHSLDVLAARLGVDIRGRHSALGDALATGEIFVRLVELLKRRGIRTLGQALEAGSRARRGGAP